ncbi:MAG: DNA topoisomerase I, partial [Alphaproteobacteria bacterium]
EIERTTVDLASRSGDVGLRATGSVITFDGFLALYQEGRDDGGEEEGENRLPKFAEGEEVRLLEVTPAQHFTEPPPRYSEASLVKKLEELGIGRPSTYASILSVLVERNYVRLEKKRFIPEDKGRLVTAFLENFFSRYVEYDFTAKLEAQLDDISAGKADWKAVLRDFWQEFEKRTQEVLAIRNADVLETLNDFLGPAIFRPTPENPDPRRCPSCGEGRLSLKTGRYGAFIGCSNYPECRFTRPFTNNGEDAEKAAEGPRLLGTDPESGEPVTLRHGKYGPYLQRGENGEKGEKAARVSLPRDVNPDTLDLDQALRLLSLPREIGTHPETGKPVLAGIGRYGPYVQHERIYASLKSSEEVFSVGMNRALALIADKAKKGSGGEIRALGPHPETGKPIQLMKGRYGPYVRHERVNATLPKGMEPDAVTLETALELLAAKGAKKGRGKSTGKKKAATKRKAAAK